MMQHALTVLLFLLLAPVAFAQTPTNSADPTVDRTVDTPALDPDPTPPPEVVHQSLFRLVLTLNTSSFIAAEAVAIGPRSLLAPAYLFADTEKVDIAPINWRIGEPTWTATSATALSDTNVILITLPDSAPELPFVEFALEEAIATTPLYLLYAADRPSDLVLADKISAQRVPLNGDPDPSKPPVPAPLSRDLGALFDQCGALSGIMQTEDQPGSTTSFTGVTRILEELAHSGVPKKVATDTCPPTPPPLPDPVPEQQPPGPDPALVEEAEQHLVKLGYLEGPADDVLDEYTTRAVRNFQLLQSIPSTGDVDLLLVELLRQAVAEPTHEPTEAAPAPPEPRVPSWAVPALILGVVSVTALGTLWFLWRPRVVALPPRKTQMLTIQDGRTGALIVALPVSDRVMSLTVGRSDNCDIILQGTLISRKHARIGVEAGRLFAVDLESANGVTVGDITLDPGEPYRCPADQKSLTVDIADIALIMSLTNDKVDA